MIHKVVRTQPLLVFFTNKGSNSGDSLAEITVSQIVHNSSKFDRTFVDEEHQQRPLHCHTHSQEIRLDLQRTFAICS